LTAVASTKLEKRSRAKAAAGPCCGGSPTTSRLRRLAFGWLAVYAIFLVAAPLEHHDLLCELKTPRHCSSCTSSLVGSDAARSAIVGSWTLTDVGFAVALEFTTHGILLPVRTPERSPPGIA
jgi:hypothetical protein